MALVSENCDCTVAMVFPCNFIMSYDRYKPVSAAIRKKVGGLKKEDEWRLVNGFAHKNSRAYDEVLKRYMEHSHWQPSADSSLKGPMLSSQVKLQAQCIYDHFS